jgi:hypothetical protein
VGGEITSNEGFIHAMLFQSTPRVGSEVSQIAEIIPAEEFQSTPRVGANMHRECGHAGNVVSIDGPAWGAKLQRFPGERDRL